MGGQLPLATPRAETTCIVMKDKIYILGGYDDTESLGSVECFQPGGVRGTRCLICCTGGLTVQPL